VRRNREVLFQRNRRRYGGWFVKGRVEVYTDRRIFEAAQRGASEGRAVAMTWTNLQLPDQEAYSYSSMNSVFLPESGDSLTDRVQETGRWWWPRLSVVDGGAGIFRAEGIEAADIAEAGRRLVIILEADGCASDLLLLLQLLPELQVLQLEVPIKGRVPLRVQASRDDLFAIRRMGERYMERAAEYTERLGDIDVRHMSGELTQREARELEAVVIREENRFHDDLWEEMQAHLEPW
jgi:hypothetical protein